MFSLRFLHRTKPVQHARLISNFPTLRDSKPTTPDVEPKRTTASSNPSVFGPQMIAPGKMEKKVLVWMKYYKSVEEVPDRISFDQMDKARNWFRIRLCNLLMLATIFGVMISIWYGKRRAERGETWEKINMDWHKSINEDHEQEKAGQVTVGK